MCILTIKNAHYRNNLHLLQVIKVTLIPHCSPVINCHIHCTLLEHFNFMLLYTSTTFKILQLITNYIDLTPLVTINFTDPDFTMLSL